MNRLEKRGSGASLLLMELVLGLLIFAFCAAICTRIFATAYQLSAQSDALTHAVSITQQAAESVRAGKTVSDAMYDAQGVATAENPVFFLHTAHLPTADGLMLVQLTVADADGRTLYTLTTLQGEDMP